MMARLAAMVLWACVAAMPAAAQAYGPPAPDGDPPQHATMRTIASAVSDTDRQRLTDAVGRLSPQRPGIVDAYVIAVALDSDPVFGREAREAAKVLAARYDAGGRTLVLAGPDGRTPDALPRGSPTTLAGAIAAVEAAMNPAEDVLILYITAHGSPDGIVHRDHGRILALLSPAWLDKALRVGPARNRLVMISACFSGRFVPMLAAPDAAVITAAASNRTSFGCQSDNDWTFFGDALINHALRKDQPLDAAFGEARRLIGTWESAGRLIPSNPQYALGANAAAWLAPLEARRPRAASAPVGRPATDALDKAIAANH